MSNPEDHATERAIEAAGALADELRAIGKELVHRHVEPEALDRALETARELRPLLTGPPRARWYEAEEPDLFASGTSNAFEAYSPLRGRINTVAPPLRMERGTRADGTPCIVGHVRLSSVYEGPPRGVHGGLVAALFDEVLGEAMSLAPPPGVTAKLSVDYRHLTPVEEDLRLEAWITDARDRRIRGQATCHAGETLTAEARALFVRVDFKQVEDRMRARSKDD